MPFRRGTRKAYWDSYRLLENQLLRLSHSICFDDHQIQVYSSELADIINSACIKIESLAKDIYEEHIWPFQMDNGVVPRSYTDGKWKRTASKFKAEEWIRDRWKFDYNCLVEIDNRFSLSKKRIELKIERFHFKKYGSTILPFGGISLNECMGGYWEYSEWDPWKPDTHKFKNVDWCKSYQEIKHNYIQSIPEHGTIRNAIMVLAAYYLLAIYDSCLPFKQYEMEDKADNYQLDFDSELFLCRMCNFCVPPCIVDSDLEQYKMEQHEREKDPDRQAIFAEQDLLNDIEGLPFLVTLNEKACKEVRRLVDEYCVPRELAHFDIAPYERENGLVTGDAGAVLYLKLKKYIRAPYYRNNICISFNTGTDHIYEDLLADPFEYEKSKHKNQNAAVINDLRIGDFVDAKFHLGEEVVNGEVANINEHTIYVAVQVDGVRKTMIEPIWSLEYIRKRE